MAEEVLITEEVPSLHLTEVGGDGVKDKVKSEQLDHEDGQEIKLHMLDKAKNIISTLSLTSVRMGHFLVILKSEFDLNISGEPYIAVMLLLDLNSGKFISRVWNQTLSTGYALDEATLMEACKSLFCGGRPCPGHQVSEKPFPRKLSSKCKKVLDNDVGADEITCVECSKVSKVMSMGVVKEEEVDIDVFKNGDEFGTKSFVPDNVNADDFEREGYKYADFKTEGDIITEHENNDEDFESEGDKKVDTGEKQIDHTEIKCRWCNSVFNTNQALYNHRKREHFWGSFPCPKCEYKTTFAQNLIDHIEQQHGIGADKKHINALLIECPECIIGYNYALIKSHYESCVTKLCKDRRIECPICLKMCIRGLRYKRHLRITHFFGKFECIQCGSIANYAADLVKHMNEQSHILDPFVLCPVCKKKVPFQEIQPHYESCVKETDKVELQEKYEKEKAMSYRTSKICPTCGKTVKNLLSHQKSRLCHQGLLEEKYFCHKCGKNFYRKQSLKIHVKNVHSQVSVTCQICSKQFSNEAAMYKHKREHGPKLQCEYCEYQTANRYHLDRHKEKHFDPKYKCSQCGKMLKSEESLLAHERDHTGERPFVCKVCGKGFKQRSVLGNHTKHVHKILTPRMKPIVKRTRKN